jgi:hypothetical protein
MMNSNVYTNKPDSARHIIDHTNEGKNPIHLEPKRFEQQFEDLPNEGDEIED